MHLSRLAVLAIVASLLFIAVRADTTTTSAAPTNTSEPDHDHDHEHEEEEKREAAEKKMVRDTVDALKGSSVAIMILTAIVVWVALYTCRHVVASKLPPWVETLAVSYSAGVFIYIGAAHLLAEGQEVVGKVTEERFRAGYACCVLMYFVTLFFQRGFGLGEGHSHSGHAHEDSDAPETVSPTEIAVGPSSESPESANQPSSPSMPESAPKNNSDNISGVALTLVAFSLHAFAEGFSLGLQTTVAGVVMMMIAICSHQWAEVLTFSTFALRKIPNNHIARFALMFAQALICPIGIAVGWGVATSSALQVVGYALCLASGTFLCVGMTELIPELMDPNNVNIPQWIAAVFGAGTMYLIQVLSYNPEAHQHG